MLTPLLRRSQFAVNRLVHPILLTLFHRCLPTVIYADLLELDVIDTLENTGKSLENILYLLVKIQLYCFYPLPQLALNPLHILTADPPFLLPLITYIFTTM